MKKHKPKNPLINDSIYAIKEVRINPGKNKAKENKHERK
jgi:hypothetical protein